MGSEKDYGKLLRGDAERVDKNVKDVLKEFKDLLPLFEKGKLESRYEKSKDSGLTFDYHEWRLERDKDFILSYLRVILRCDRIGYIMSDIYNPHFVAVAGSFEKPNWGAMLVGSRGESEQRVIMDNLDLDDLRLALIQAVRSGLSVAR